MKIKLKVNKWGPIKLKNLGTPKETIKKTTLTMGENMCKETN